MMLLCDVILLRAMTMYVIHPTCDLYVMCYDYVRNSFYV